MGLNDTKDATFREDGTRIPHSHKRGGVTPLSSSLAADLDRGRFDKPFFSRRFLGIEEHPGQRRFSIAATMTADDGYSPAFLDIAQASGNQAGKTINLATTVLHHAFYKFGLKPPDPSDPRDVDRWVRAQYHWYHISYEGKVANLVHNDIVKLLTGSHPAQQGRGCPIVDELGPIVEWDRKEFGEFAWIKVHPMFGGGSALSASHKWVGDMHKRDSAASNTTLSTTTIDSGSSGAFRTNSQTINALLSATYFWLSTTWTKTGTPGNLLSQSYLTYRIVAS